MSLFTAYPLNDFILCLFIVARGTSISEHEIMSVQGVPEDGEPARNAAQPSTVVFQAASKVLPYRGHGREVDSSLPKGHGCAS